MITITNAPLGHSITGVLRAGDPQSNPADSRLVVVPFPFPQAGPPTWLSVDANGTISASPSIGANEVFQESKPKGFLECERSGPLQFGVAYGYF